MKFITLVLLKNTVITTNEIPINQGLNSIVVSRDFVSGLLLGAAFIFMLIGLGLFKKSDS